MTVRRKDCVAGSVIARMNMGSEDFFLFVSHVTEDRTAASQVVDELERRGVRCWIAPRNVRPGGTFDDDIADAIESCRAMLLIFSSRCNESEYIRREITVAENVNKIIIPFRIEDVEPKRGLSVRLANLHWIDAFVAREWAIDEVVRSLQPSSTGSPRQASRLAASDEVKARWSPPPKAQPTSTVALPWTPVKGLRGARVLTVIGASWLALIALGAVACAAVVGLQRQKDWEMELILFSVVAVLVGGCAVGTYFNWRVASVVGFVLAFVGLAAGTLVVASRGVMTPALIIVLLFCLPAIAGILGTFATAGVLSDHHRLSCRAPGLGQP
jgi:TIR domain